MSALLAGVLRDIRVALAGRAGCRLARALRAAASRQVLLRLVMAVPDPQRLSPGCSEWTYPGSSAARP